MKLKFNEAKLKPVMCKSRNVLDLNGSVREEDLTYRHVSCDTKYCDSF